MKGKRHKKKKYLYLVIFFILLVPIGYSMLLESLSLNVGILYSPSAFLKSTTPDDNTYFRSEKYKTKIKTITFENKIDIDENAIETWDISNSQNGNIMSYIVYNSEDSAYYDLYIQSDTIIYANTDMSNWFRGFTSLDAIVNLELLDTRYVNNMSHMFYNTGSNSQIFTLDLSSFNTSNVTNMSYMFYKTGYKSSMLSINVDNFNTSNVTDMSHMFRETGGTNPSFTLDVSKFNTSKVTNMDGMFRGIAPASTIFKLDLSKFNTSNVKNMNGMFMDAAKKSLEFTLNLSNFNTANVTGMSHMFYYAGYSSPVFELNVSSFDTSKVSLMDNMFYYSGYSNPNFKLNVSNFNTNKVTNMYGMFFYTGYNSTVFNMDLKNFDFSNVGNVGFMLHFTGYNSTKFITSIKITNPNIQTYNDMFYGVATKGDSQITVYYDEITEALVDLMIATKTSTSNVVKGGEVITDTVEISIGDYISIDVELFNVISIDSNTVTLLAAYSLNSNYRQQKGTTYAMVAFAEQGGWEYTPGPEDIDIEAWTTDIKNYVNEYTSYLKDLLKSDDISGNLITLKELGKLDCDVPELYGWTGTHTCANSKYTWIANGQSWWSRSAYNGNASMVWTLNYNGYQSNSSIDGTRGVRPTITLPMEVINQNLDKIIISKK